MNANILHSKENMTLVGGGSVSKSDLEWSLLHAPRVIAADGGADSVFSLGHRPAAAIGDFDSISETARAAISENRLFPISEQDSTDFEKCLRLVRAPILIGLGFLGQRLDHQLAALNVLVRYSDQRCLLVGPNDVAVACPKDLSLTLPIGTRVSLFPMAPVQGRSEGLEWPIDGIDFAPGGAIGTSNRTTAAQVRLQFEGPGMVLLLPRASAEAILSALQGL